RYSPERLMPDLVRTLTRISGAATEIPVQSQEILEDLRKGRLEVRTREPMLPLSIDVLGRRTYSGMVVGSLIVSTAILISQDWVRTGVLFFVAAVGWGMLHTTWSAWISRKKKRN